MTAAAHKRAIMTRYYWSIQTLCAGQWEEVNAEITQADAVRSVKEYRENMPNYCHRIKRLKED